MSAETPKSRPQATADDIRALLKKHGITEKVAVVAVRGYYRDTMGKAGVNDRAIYDDALFIITPDYFRAFNANTDPSVYREAVATLRPGVWRYKPGPHPLVNGYPAFRQAADVQVSRDKRPGWFKGLFGINIHKGGFNSTSSLGCQTIHPSQWAEFQGALMRELAQYGQKAFYYLLIEGPIR